MATDWKACRGFRSDSTSSTSEGSKHSRTGRPQGRPPGSGEQPRRRAGHCVVCVKRPRIFSSVRLSPATHAVCGGGIRAPSRWSDLCLRQPPGMDHPWPHRQSARPDRSGAGLPSAVQLNLDSTVCAPSPESAATPTHQPRAQGLQKNARHTECRRRQPVSHSQHVDRAFSCASCLRQHRTASDAMARVHNCHLPSRSGTHPGERHEAGNVSG